MGLAALSQSILRGFKRVSTVYGSTLSAESACKIFVFLGMVKYSAWFEGCYMSQRQCRFSHGSVYCALEVM